MHNCPLWASKQTSARIDFLRQGGWLVGKKGTFYVKICAEKLTRTEVDEMTGGMLTSRQVNGLAGVLVCEFMS